MPRPRAQDLAVGTVFALALCVVALALMALGGEVPGFSDRAIYRVVFPNAEGLLPGAPVRMAGVDIGAVSEIRLPKNPEVAGIEVQLSIHEEYAPRVRADSEAGLRILQLLTNEKYVEITPGSPEVPQLEENAELPIAPQGEILQQGEAIAENLVEITAALRRILEPLERGEGLLGRVLLDPEFGIAGTEALGKTLENLQQLTDDMLAGRGVAGRLLYDKELSARLDTLGTAIEQLSDVVAAIDRREGLIGELLVEGGKGEQAIEELQAAAASLRRVADRVDSEDSFIGDLLRQPSCPTSPTRNICDTLESLAQVSGKLNSGQGTLGALINDRTLHDSALEVVGGVNDSTFVRWFLRRYRKKGIEAREAGIAEEELVAPGEPVKPEEPEEEED